MKANYLAVKMMTISVLLLFCFCDSAYSQHKKNIIIWKPAEIKITYDDSTFRTIHCLGKCIIKTKKINTGDSTNLKEDSITISLKEKPKKVFALNYNYRIKKAKKVYLTIPVNTQIKLFDDITLVDKNFKSYKVQIARSRKINKQDFTYKNQKFAKRYYYDFSKKMLLDSPDLTAEIIRPVYYKANKDITIELFNYNPLKDEIIIEESSSQRFLEDTATFAKLIVIPEVSKTSISELAVPKPTEDKSGSTRKKSDYDSLLSLKVEFDCYKDLVASKMIDYKLFLTRIEMINDVFDYLKGAQILKKESIISSLDNMFLNNLNEFLSDKGDDILNTTVTNVGKSELLNLEIKYFAYITGIEKEMELIKKQVDGLNCEKCDDKKQENKIFFALKIDFIAAFTEEKEYLKELKNTRVEKIIPAFNKTMVAYDKLLQLSQGIPNFVTKAVTIDKDLHSITIYQKESGGTNKTAYDIINIEPICGWKIDVGSGIFISGLHDEQYKLKSYDSINIQHYLFNGKVIDTTILDKYTVFYRQSQLKASFGGMIYLHAHTQNPSLLNYGISLGMGAMFTDKARLAGSGCLTLLIGKKQRFTMNIGGVAAQVIRLDTPYEIDKYYHEDIDNVPTSLVWNLSWMVGCSWNFK